MEEVGAMRGILPVAIKASEILGVDEDLRTAWRELLDNLTPLPTVEDGQTGLRRYNTQGALLYYDLVTLENDDPQTVSLSKATFLHRGIDPNMPVHVLSRSSVLAAKMGRSDVLRVVLPRQIRCVPPDTGFCHFVQTGRTAALANRMTLREGVNAIGVQRLGLAAEALHLALCQSVPPGPAQDSVIRLFAAWPKDWDAAYTLLCRGGFLVTSSIQDGQIEFVQIKSQLGGQCRLRNPWPDAEVTLFRDGKNWMNMKGSLLRFETDRNQVLVIVPKGVSQRQYKRVILGRR
jgi:hypothetical protein